MELTFSRDVEAVVWEDLAYVFELAPLGHRDPVRLEAAFQGSTLCCFVYCQSRLIAAGRVLSDGVGHAVIFDVVVLPEYQGQGVGRQVMEVLTRDVNVPKVFLYAVPGKEGFYERLGFRRMKTAFALFANPEGHRENGYLE